MNHIYLSYPETESIIVCPVGHPMISTLCLWEREICNFSRGRRDPNINDIRIKYVKVLDRLYKVEKISFLNFSVLANETDKTISDVPAGEVLDITDFKDFHITLGNWHGKVADFVE